MRAFLRVLRRSRHVPAATQKCMGKDASSSLMGDLSCSNVRNCNTGLGMSRKCASPFPFHMPLRLCSSEITRQTAMETVQDAPCSDAPNLVKEIAECAGHFLQSHPQVMEFVAYSSMFFISYHVFPRMVLFLRSKSQKYAEYEKCINSALAKTEKELFKYYPVASLGLIAFCEMALVIAPSMKVYMSQLWEGASIISIIWFLSVLKQNFIVEAKKKSDVFDLNWLSHFDKVSSIGLIALGILGVAEVGGLSLQSLVTITGAGVYIVSLLGVLTAFAAKDVLGNILNGFSLHLTEPFIVGEYIKAGSVEGTVLEIGLTCTSLVNQDNLPITVPNSYFLNQVIVNRSRAFVRVCVTKIPIKFEDVDKIFALTSEVNLMLKTNPLVTLKRQDPCCYISRIGKLYGELVISCETELKNEELIVFEQGIILEALKIMKANGVEVGDPLPSGDLEALLEAAKIIRSREASYND